MSIDASKDPSRIASMFDAIARRYDFLNHVLSGGLDIYWRRRAIAALDLSAADVLLDVCAGTADVAIGAMRGTPRARRVIGVDFAGAMLAIGRDKIARANLAESIALVRGDAMRLPIRGGAVNAVTVAFGIRNVSDPLSACREMSRALAPGGRLAILEFSMPRHRVLKTIYAGYFRWILPVVGRAVSGHAEAYSYLPASVTAFPEPDAFATLLQAAGFTHVEARPLTFGTVYLYLGKRRVSQGEPAKNTVLSQVDPASALL